MFAVLSLCGVFSLDGFLDGSMLMVHKSTFALPFLLFCFTVLTESCNYRITEIQNASLFVVLYLSPPFALPRC